MSELEIQRRRAYKSNRKKWMFIQLVAIIVLAAISLSLFLTYNRMNRIYYIEYTENSNIDYTVHYIENDYFENGGVGKDRTYISSLISGINADFLYTLNMDSAEMGFNYNYKIDAKLIIADKDTGAPYYTADENILPVKNMTVNGTSTVQINENVYLDYVKYDTVAREFTEAYNLGNATSTLVVTLDIEILSSGAQLEKDCRNTYTTSLNVPLAVKTFGIHSTSSSPENEVKVLACKGGANRLLVLTFSIISAILTVALAITLMFYLHFTTNEDITYAAKIRKLLRAYGSYIHRMEGEFDCDGYQIVMIKTFNEMLGIRDTLQAPILMSENRDETMTRFFIPAETNLLYVFDIKVDNYDEIYKKYEEPSIF